MEREAVRAPELRGSAWFNTDRPLTLADLRGKLVLLDFWTSCCINCLHILEDLKYLEHKYADRPFAVVGVHSPKFAHEDDAGSLRQAILRYGIAHPVLLDSGRRTWDAYAIRGWPTLVLVDPRGYVLGRVSGEGHRDQLDGAIGRALDLLAEAGELNGQPLPLRLEAESGALSQTAPLLYPGKILADAASAALYVADTGHHRLILSSLDGTHAETGGSGVPGAEDGDLVTASFRSPQGMALDSARGWLYVADTGNHLIRRIDLQARTVSTLAGTGSQGFTRPGLAPARETALNSPWDLALLDGTLYIAMAGLHQIWSYDPNTERLAVVAGSGAEGRADGSALDAALAQPSGLATDGRVLYVADSEISCIRAVAPGPGGTDATVRTLAGGDLFQFGDRDGVGDSARFQHPLGVAWVPEGEPGGGYLYIADTYNSTLRRLDPASRAVTTLATRFPADEASSTPDASSTPGAASAPVPPPRFDEPSGLSYAAGALYIADTNNSAVRIVTLPDARVRTLDFPGLCAPGFCLPG